jgi:hypothetical protein
MKTNPNESVYPVVAEVMQNKHYTIPASMMKVLSSGLTKREHFAGLAMQGLLANHELIDTVDWEWIANNSIALADNLIEELNKKSWKHQ